MASIIVNPLTPATINQSGTDDVSFTAAGTLTIAGTAAAPISVTLSKVAGAALGTTINISNADVQLGGTAGVSAITAYNVGTGGTLRLNSTLNVGVGSTINLSGPNSTLVVGSGASLDAFSAIAGFGPGKTIDLTGLNATRVAYADRIGTDTGGTLTLYGANNAVVSTLNLSSGEYTAANFNVAGDGAAGTLLSFASAVTGTAVSSGSTTLGPGGVATFGVSLSNPAVVTGTPTLTLNDGGVATFDPTTSTASQLMFTYTVAPGQNTPGLAVTGVSLNGGTLTPVGGGVVDLSGAIGSPVGTLVVDTLAPTVAAITALPGTGTVGPGQAVMLNVALSEPVTVVGGTPTLSLSDGGTATLNTTASTPTNLAFTYTVQPGQNTADLTVTGVNANAATLLDAAGNPLNLASVVNDPLGVAVDTILPTLTSLATDPVSGQVGIGRTVTFTAATSEPVTVTGGTPSLTLSDGGTATFDPTGSTPTSLAFRTTVQAGQNTSDLAVTGASLNGATVADAANNVLNLASLVTNPAGVLAVDTLAPTVTAVTTDPVSGTLGSGQVVHVNVATSEPVTVAGTAPTLTLSDGGTATYNPVTSTPTVMVFDHTVLPGESTADLIITAANTAGTTIADAAANQLNLAAAVGNPAGLLVVDALPVVSPIQLPSVVVPTITGVSTLPGSGNVAAGGTVRIAVATDQPVSVANGTPTLALSDGGLATYDPALSTPTSLVFTNTVQPGQTSTDLAVVGSSLNGATIADASGGLLSLAGAAVNPPGILTIGLTQGTGTTMGGTTTGGTTTGGTTTGGTTTGGTSTGSTGTGSTGTTDQGSTGGITGTTGTGTGAAGTGTTTGSTGATTPSYGTIPIYRFFESTNGTHFYTPNANERAQILQTRPDLIPEGQNGVGLTAVDPTSGDPNAVQVFRFFDTVHGTQFLTASTTERDTVLATRSDLTYEPGGSFFEHTQPQAGDTAVYRFFSSTDGTHFYTDSASERATILQTRPDLIAEGIGFYEPKHT